MKDFEKFAGLISILAAVSVFAYAISFIILSRSNPSQAPLLSGLFLMFSGFLITAPLVAVYNRLKETEPGFALWALLLGVGASLGMAAHGGYDLANATNPPISNLLPALSNLPSQVDPRGLLTFGIGGAALLVISWMMSKSKLFPSTLAYIGLVSALLSLTLYFGRLIILSPANPLILYPALVNGFIINPLFYLWLGMVLKRK